MANWGFSHATHSTASVGTTSGTVLAANTSAKYRLFINDSDTVQYLGLGTAAVLNKGIRLGTAGGFYEMSRAYGNMFQGVVMGIASSAGKTILITEA